ncbi:MAG: manganese efflux pump [Clostridia bacterium]|nr:manganese efflux pump [Clostridia bacterium]
MNWSFVFFAQSVLLGVGLAMDAFSVSLANGLNETGMKVKRMCLIAGVFAFFQALMPMTGWVCVHTIAQYFSFFQQLIPWIALVLLAFIGGKMIKEAFECQCDDDANQCCCKKLGFGALIIQGVATSIDALSVGFTISDYNWLMALVCALIIAVVTFFICFCGIIIGKQFGTALSGKASILGGVILILIGLEIFITGVFF